MIIGIMQNIACNFYAELTFIRTVRWYTDSVSIKLITYIVND
jgi:hypothetical protein